MKDEKNLTKSITVIAVVFFILAVAMVGAASAKSLYVIANHHTKQFDAWNINPDGTSTYQFKVNLAYASSPADIAIDESSNVLFITSEGGTTIEMVNATTMALLGHIYIYYLCR
jgi:6-phosphogluconolactonase (cycloisomerase 2 family)